MLLRLKRRSRVYLRLISMMMKSKIITTLFGLIVSIAINLMNPTKAWAQNDEATYSVPADFYEIIYKNAKLQAVLGDRNVEDLVPEEFQQLLNKINAGLFDSSAKGEVKWDETEQAYKIKTDIKGRYQGQVKTGRYLVELKPIKNVFVTGFPVEFMVGRVNKDKLEIGVSNRSPGRAKVWRQGYTKWRILLTDKMIKIIPTKLNEEDVEFDSRPERDLELSIYNDANSNGIRDDGERDVEWANMEVWLRPVGRVMRRDLKIGMNKIVFNKIPVNIESTDSLLYELMSTPDSSIILSWQDKKTQHSAGLINGDLYGPLLDINNNQDYHLVLDKEAVAWWVY